MSRLISLFLLFSGLTGIILILLLFRIHVVGQKVSWKIDNPRKILIIGDSHIESSLNDQLDKDIYNLSESGDCYLYTYTKLKQFLKSEPSPDTVFLGIDYHNMDATADEWYSNTGYLNYKMPLSYPYMSMDELGVLYKSNMVGFVKSMSYILSLNSGMILDKRVDVGKFGGFKAGIKTMGKDSLYAPYISKYNSRISENQLRYLDSITNLCLKKQVVLCFITTPVHKTVARNMYLESKIREYGTNKKIRHFNFRNLAMDDSCFADKYHLNNRGADVFTTYFKVYRYQNQYTQ